MASFVFPSHVPISLRRCHSLPHARPIDNRLTFQSASSSSPLDLYKSTFHPSFHSRRNFWSGRFRTAASTPEPPPEEHRSSSSGVLASFTRFKDTAQVFFAVLFWMSLFFWSSAWDGGNSGRPNKRTRSKK